MQKILFVAHCVLNTASKVVMYNESEMAAEEALRVDFVKKALLSGVQLIQLPCRSFALRQPQMGQYPISSTRRISARVAAGCCEDIVLQLREFRSNGTRFEVGRGRNRRQPQLRRGLHLRAMGGNLSDRTI